METSGSDVHVDKVRTHMCYPISVSVVIKLGTRANCSPRRNMKRYGE
jgi:hypothetical protein